jgi:hypothetical protein
MQNDIKNRRDIAKAAPVAAAAMLLRHANNLIFEAERILGVACAMHDLENEDHPVLVQLGAHKSAINDIEESIDALVEKLSEA